MDNGKTQVPSLVELCTKVAIQNFKYIASVTGLDLNLLEPILPLCSAEQLAEIESCTTGLDLSPITDKLWMRFYENEFGLDSVDSAIQRINNRKRSFKWKELYEAKLDEREEDHQRIREKLRRSYAENAARKQSKKIKMTTKIPNSGNKRRGSGSSSFTSYKNPLMKKAKIEHLQSRTSNRQKVKPVTQVIKRSPSQQTGSSSNSSSKSSPNQTWYNRAALQPRSPGAPGGVPGPTRQTDGASGSRGLAGTSSQTRPSSMPSQPRPTSMARQTTIADLRRTDAPLAPTKPGTSYQNKKIDKMGQVHPFS